MACHCRQHFLARRLCAGDHRRDFVSQKGSIDSDRRPRPIPRPHLLAPRRVHAQPQYRSHRPRVIAGARNVAGHRQTSSPESAIEWVARTNYLPLLTAGQRPIFATDDQALQGIAADNFQPSKVVYLTENARSLITTSNYAPCTLSNTKFTPQRVEADTDS